MKITIESTTKLVEINGLPARVWEGQTESGVALTCFINLIEVRDDQDLSQFNRELTEQRAPSAAVKSLPLKMIL
jgi:hypothetical protein